MCLILPFLERNLKISAIIVKVNNKLDDLCNSFSFPFIADAEITRDFLCNDSAHLKEEGTYILARFFKILFILNWLTPSFKVKKKKFTKREGDDLVSTAERENDCCKQNHKICDLKRKQQTIDIL